MRHPVQRTKSAPAASIVLVYRLLVVVHRQPRTRSPVNFVFFKTEASLFVVLLLAIALGFVAGWLFDDVRDRRRRRRDNP